MINGTTIKAKTTACIGKKYKGKGDNVYFLGEKLAVVYIKIEKLDTEKNG